MEQFDFTVVEFLVGFIITMATDASAGSSRCRVFGVAGTFRLVRRARHWSAAAACVLAADSSGVGGNLVLFAFIFIMGITCSAR